MALASTRRRRTLLLVLADAIGINVAFAAAYALRYELQLGGPIAWYNDVPYGEYAPWGIVLSVILLGIFRLERLYGPSRRAAWLDSIYALTSSTVVGVALLTLLIYGLRPMAQSRLMLPYTAVLVVCVLGLIRLVDVQLRRRRLRRGEGVRRTLIVGAGERGRAVMRNILCQPDTTYGVVGFLDDDPAKRAQAIGRYPPLGSTDELADVLEQQDVDIVIITLPWRTREKIVQLVDQCEEAGAQARVVPDLFQMSLNRVDLESLGGIPLITVREPIIRGWHYRLKRALDIALSSLLLAASAPFLLMIALAIRLDSPGPVLFRQQRVGRDGRLFTFYKFRSMIDGADSARAKLHARNEAVGPIFKIREDPRLTRVGRVLRRLSLDELPQLWNVLRGDMSLVGPRPPMPSEVKQYEEWHHRRLDVAPGLTGLWQVSGRSDLTFDEMVMLDLFYAENWSLGLDIKILLRTVPTVIMGTGAY